MLRSRLCACAVALAPIPTAAGQLRVVTYNVAEVSPCDVGAFRTVFAMLNEDDKPGFPVAPHLYVFQEVNEADVSTLCDILNDEAEYLGVTYTLGSYTNDDGSGGLEASGAQAMFYRSDTLIEVPGEHTDLPTTTCGSGRDVEVCRQSDRWKLRIIGHDGPESEFYIFSSHLRPNDALIDQADRLAAAQMIRADADALPEGSQIIYAGDFNFADANEAGYLEFLAPGAAQAFDPLGSDSWAGPDNAIKHTQSPRVVLACGLIHGGLDDRFDFQLVTLSLLDGEGISLMTSPWAYRALGNDGLHYDAAINDPPNAYYEGDPRRSAALADALHDASDHLPVVAEYVAPTPVLCEGDVDRNGVVDVHDLVGLILDWGPCSETPCAACPADVSGDASVTVDDLLVVIIGWGDCTR